MIRSQVLAAAVLLGAMSYPASSAQATVHLFDLDGKFGPGMNAGNETNTVVGTPGSGGEVGAGITYDDATNLLSINIAWGSSNGFTDLTGNATAAHIHGPTANPAPMGFNQSASPVAGLAHLSTLSGWNPSASGGGVTGSLTLNATQEAELLAERYYINVHTATNGPGEIRGHLVIVPEPGSSMALLGGAGLLLRRRRSAA